MQLNNYRLKTAIATAELMMGTVIPNIIGIASNICLFASSSPMPPISIAKTPPLKPADNHIDFHKQ